MYWSSEEHKQSNQQFIESYDLAKGHSVQRIQCPIIKSMKYMNSSVFMYCNKITLLRSNAENHSKVILYQLQYNTNFSWSWQKISSKADLTNLDLNNNIALQYKENLILANVVNHQSSTKIFFHLYLQNDNEGCWKSFSLPIPQLQKISAISTCFIQSCVMVLDQIHYTVKCDNRIYINQVDVASPTGISSIWQGTQASTYFLDDPTALKCFLSVLDGEVVLIIVKSVNNITNIEIKQFKSTTSQQLCITHQFSSLVEVVTATVVLDTRSITIVYHDHEWQSCHLKMININ